MTLSTAALNIEEFKIKFVHTHFSGIEFGPKGEKRHLPINKHPDFETLAKEIMKRNIDITIICESPMLELDSLKMKKTFEKIGYKF